MKKIFIVFLIIVILLAGGMYFFTNNRNQTNKSRGNNTNNTISYCAPQDIHASLSFDAAAGNIYGTYIIKNNSNKKCQINGNAFITPEYATTIKNISLEHLGTTEENIFELSPNQTLYSRIHFPNGPQCSSGIQTAQVIFRYAISPIDMTTFVNQDGKKEENITICNSPSEVTTIQIWNISTKPIIP